MRVAIVAPPWLPVPPPAYGGTEAVLDNLAQGLQAEGHEVLLVTTGDSTSPVPKCHFYEHSIGVGLGNATSELNHVLYAYEQFDEVDIVHDHTLVGPLYSEWFPHLRVVTTNHGPFEGDLNPFYRAICDRVPIIAISRHQASTAPGVRVARVIHHGIDVNQFPVGQGKGGYALFLGRCHPDKGVHVAAAVARQAGLPLLIAAKCSEPMEVEYFESRVRPLLGGDIRFIGEADRQTKLDLLADATCLLNPIDWAEPFGMVMLEALACGTPVVATARGAVPEIVEDGRVGFVCSDPATLVEALAKVGTIDRSVCRSYVAERFSLTRMVNEHVALYEEILSESSKPEHKQ